MIKTKLTWYSLSTVVFPQCPTLKSSMRIPVKVASARERHVYICYIHGFTNTCILTANSCLFLTI